MSSPLITVYITNYNYEKYIKQAIESVLNQTFQNFELFIIDDGSTDDSKRIIESYSNHPQINIIYQQNKGLNITNNIALRLANGKYIMRLDADDYLVPHSIEKMADLLESDNQLGMVFPDYFLVDAQNNITAEIKRHDFKEEVNLLDQPAHGACTMIRTEFLNAVGGYDENYTCQDGYELWIKYTARFKVLNISDSLFYYRQHGENLTTNENRILDTRRSIHDNFIKNNRIHVLTTIAILPIRGTKIHGKMLALTKISDRTILDIRIANLLSSKHLTLIVVSSSLKVIRDYVESNYGQEERVKFIERPQELARFNISLLGTIDHILNYDSIKKIEPKAFVIVPIEYVFQTGEIIDDAINSMVIFKSDSVISVRTEHATYYQHHGNGMVPIMEQANFTRLEREALYKGIGGIQLVKIENYQKERKLLAGKVGHIVVDQKTAQGVFSGYDLTIVEYLFEKEQKVVSVSK